MEFRFSGLRAEGGVEEEWQLLLHLIADFEIKIHATLLYREVDFPVVELASCIAEWQKSGGDLSYTSMESELSPLLAFMHDGQGNFQFCSPHASTNEAWLVPREALERAAGRFVVALRTEVLRSIKVDIARVL